MISFPARCMNRAVLVMFLMLCGCPQAYKPPPMHHVERANYGGAAEQIASGLLTVSLKYEGIPKVQARVYVDGMEWSKSEIHGGEDTVELTGPCALLGNRKLQIRFFTFGVERQADQYLNVRENGWTQFGPSFTTSIQVAQGRETVVDLIVSEERVAVLSNSLRENSLANVSTSAGGAPQQRTVRLESPVDLPGTPGAKRPSSWALIIGVEAYRDIPPARFAENDALAMARHTAATMGIPEDQTRVLLNDRATRTDIDVALNEWLPTNVQPGDSVVLFWSGHGAPDTDTGKG